MTLGLSGQSQLVLLQVAVLEESLQVAREHLQVAQESLLKVESNAADAKENHQEAESLWVSRVSELQELCEQEQQRTGELMSKLSEMEAQTLRWILDTTTSRVMKELEEQHTSQTRFIEWEHGEVAEVEQQFCWMAWMEHQLQRTVSGWMVWAAQRMERVRLIKIAAAHREQGQLTHGWQCFRRVLEHARSKAGAAGQSEPSGGASGQSEASGGAIGGASGGARAIQLQVNLVATMTEELAVSLELRGVLEGKLKEAEALATSMVSACFRVLFSASLHSGF